MNRRGFLAGILASGFAPAAIGSGVLMPVKGILVVPKRWEFVLPWSFEGVTVTAQTPHLIVPLCAIHEGHDYGPLVLQGRPVY
jgi:hypothetical protein